MSRRIVSFMVVTLLFTAMFVLTCYTRPAKANGSIYIRPDGSVDPPTAPISTIDNVIYTFTDNIYDEIVVERDDIVIDGAAFTLQGSGAYGSEGINLTRRSNVVIENMIIKTFSKGISFVNSSNIWISGNNITNNRVGVLFVNSSNIWISGNSISGNSYDGIFLGGCSNNSITGNRVANNVQYGIMLMGSSNTTIVENNITNNTLAGITFYHPSSNDTFIIENNITNNKKHGISLWYSPGTTIVGNNIANNMEQGIELAFSSDNYIAENNFANNPLGIDLWEAYNNNIYHNNFVDNTKQIRDNLDPSINNWDRGYPSGGNYWDDYTGVDLYNGPYQNETGGDGIGDTPYVIDSNNQDRYPLMDLYKSHSSHDVGISRITPSKNVIGQGFTLHINIRIRNYGNFTENFNLTAYYNVSILIETQAVTLESDAFATITFTWNTTGVRKGDYTIGAIADIVPDEVDTADNTLTGGRVIVAMVGDITGPEGWPDGKCDIKDVALVAKKFGVIYPDTRYDPNCDLTGPTLGVADHKIDIKDVALVAKHYGDIDP